MNRLFPIIRTFSIFGVLTLAAFNGVAQKLPNKQEGSVRAPAKVKIDGKATEWDFKAYNNATDVFYTIAHDEVNIYLVIKAADESIVRKIVSGGVSFIMNSVKDKTRPAATVTFPVFDYKNKPDVRFSVKSAPIDSLDILVSSNNKKFTAQAKFIKTAGIEGVSPSLSVYNTDGIIAASSFDKDMNYIYELAVPRKLVQQAVNDEGKFSYKVLLNPIQIGDIPGVDIKRDANGNVIGVNIEKALSGKLSESAQLPTDFSGEYILTQ